MDNKWTEKNPGMNKSSTNWGADGAGGKSKSVVGKHLPVLQGKR